MNSVNISKLILAHHRRITSKMATRSLSSSSSSTIMDYSKYFSRSSSSRKPSAIRKLQPLVDQPGMISLGGGLPNPSLFPVTDISFKLETPDVNGVKDIQLSSSEVATALQYSPSSGIPGLKKQLIDIQKKEHNPMNDIDLSITVGSQDAFCKAIEMLIDPSNYNDCLFLETPTYSGSLAFLHPYQAQLKPIPIDQDGLIPEALEEALEKPECKDLRTKVLYTIPTAQNPSGVTLSAERRSQIYKLAQKHDIIILEDDPYYFLHPNRDELPSLLSMDVDGRVLRFDSMSKLISSGLRIGYVTGPIQLIEKINYHIMATNLHNSGLSQIMLHKILTEWGDQGFNDHCDQVASFYSQRREIMLAAANKHLTGLAEWYIPDAGMFLWIKLNGITDTKALIEQKAAKANVLLVPGQSFLPSNESSSYVRASFSTASDSDMDTAMERLAQLIKQELQ